MSFVSKYILKILIGFGSAPTDAPHCQPPQLDAPSLLYPTALKATALISPLCSAALCLTSQIGTIRLRRDDT